MRECVLSICNENNVVGSCWFQKGLRLKISLVQTCVSSVNFENRGLIMELVTQNTLLCVVIHCSIFKSVWARTAGCIMAHFEDVIKCMWRTKSMHSR